MGSILVMPFNLLKRMIFVKRCTLTKRCCFSGGFRPQSELLVFNKLFFHFSGGFRRHQSCRAGSKLGLFIFLENFGDDRNGTIWQMCYIFGLEITFWDDYIMILHAFCSGSTKNIIKFKTSILIQNLNFDPKKSKTHPKEIHLSTPCGSSYQPLAWTPAVGQHDDGRGAMQARY